MTHTITTLPQLEALFGPVGEASVRKEIPFIHPVYRAWIEASPFALLASNGPGGLVVSPRGDPAPLVRVVDDQTLLLPERRGNNRIDSLRNLIVDPRMAILFLVPGVGETLRVNGRGTISVDPELMRSFAMGGALPKCVLEIRVETVFFQCARSIQRSKLWDPASWPTTKPPTAGAILAALTSGDIDGEAYDKELPGRQRATLY